jgi:uncharacterized membrane protein YhiD involved in acid resistance
VAAVVPELPAVASPVSSVLHFLLALGVATILGAALGIVRPVRREIKPRPIHVVHAQVLLSVVGAIIMIVVAESLARAFAIVGAAGLVRYRARIDDPKDAGVMLVALAVGLSVGVGLMLFAAAACVFVIVVLWLLESLEPAAQDRYELKVTTDDRSNVQPRVEQALQHRGVAFELVGSSPNELRYDVVVPFAPTTNSLSRFIKTLDAGGGPSIEWDIKKHKNEK